MKPSETFQPRRRASAPATRTLKQKSPPLTAEEIPTLQQRFDSLFREWDSGKEIEVEKELEAMKADALRRFADANNLNVTSKTTKQKVMALIAARFRERRQLLRPNLKR
jgi:hypothetical protein